MKKTLKQFRQQAELTQSTVAEMLNVSHDTIARWESGETQPNASQIVDICRIYDCKFDEIIWPETR